MPKTIDYPRTNYLSSWEVAEVVDDTGGKCSIEACARKLNRKVSGSFKAILGSAVKFGLLTSKREMLTTTNLFRRIKHAYDKAEEKIYHREAFLHPPLFAHICRKFRNRELPVHMLDVMLVREFGVEEINAQNVAKAFVEGARMVDVLDERNVIADIDQLSKPIRRDLASPEMGLNIFPPDPNVQSQTTDGLQADITTRQPAVTVGPVVAPSFTDDAVANLFGFSNAAPTGIPPTIGTINTAADVPTTSPVRPAMAPTAPTETVAPGSFVPIPPKPEPVPVPGSTRIGGPGTAVQDSQVFYAIRITGPGLDTHLSIQDEADLAIAQALLEKIRKRVQAGA